MAGRRSSKGRSKTKKEKREESGDKQDRKKDAWKVLVYPQLAEKSMNMVEIENKLVFMVNKKAKKEEIKEAVENRFKVRVMKVNVEITRKGEKKAYIKLHPDDSAADIASKMGML